jgi:3'(2'), 5'-bisphosphate nucleotidase
MNIDSIVAVANTSVQKAAEEVMKFYAKPNTETVLKKDNSPVTEADIAANSIICRGVEVFGYPILSEESPDDSERLSASRFWIIDPLDGTKDFINRTGEFSIMLALVEKGIPIIGIVACPAFHKTYISVKGRGTILHKKGHQKKQIHVRKTTEADKMIMLKSRNHPHRLVTSVSEAMKTKLVQQCGSNGVKAGLIAEGGADYFLNPTDKMGEWDASAPQIILEEAGGMLTDINGDKIVYNKVRPNLPNGILASSHIIHHRVASTISDCKKNEK